MKFVLILLSMLLNPGLGMAADYRLGDRLKPGSPEKFRSSDYVSITWDFLIPKGWDPAAEFRHLNLSRMSDSDPRAIAALEKLRRVYDEAPLEKSHDGKKIKIAGFAIPLERHRDEVTEFLLVPYFGACVHTPPPPANQTIHVIVNKNSKAAGTSEPVMLTGKRGLNTMDAVWVSGKIELHRAESGLGVAGYRLFADRVRPY